MTYEEIFSKSKEMILSHKTEGINGDIAVQVNIIGEGAGAFYIEVRGNRVSVEPYEYYDRDCSFTVSGRDFLKICDGSLSAVKAFTIGKLKISGSIEKALEFSKLVEKARKN